MSIKQVDQYHAAINAIRQYQDKGKAEPFCDFITERICETQKDIMRMLHAPFPKLP